MGWILGGRGKFWEGGRGIFWEGRTYTFVEKGPGVYFEREGYILGGSHIVVEKVSIFRVGEVYSWRVAHNIHLLKGGCILGGRSRYWEGRI